MSFLLVGLWIGIATWQHERERREREVLPQELPDLEFVDVSADQMFAHFTPTGDDDPRWSWEQISLRMYAEPDGSRQKLMRCKMPAIDVEATNRGMFSDMTRRRSDDDQPPDWWLTPMTGKWAIPDWWQPSGPSCYRMQQAPDGTWVAEFISYDKATGWYHLWEWSRAGVEAPPSPLNVLVCDHLAHVLTQLLISEGHPADGAGRLSVTDRAADRVGIIPTDLPPGMTRLDADIQPRGSRTPSYLLRFQDIDLGAVPALIAELPMRSIAEDSAPPAAAWAFSLRGETADGLPTWFTPGAGPRWAYVLVRPGRGTVDGARWAAYDTAARDLYVWNWVSLAPRPKETDILRLVAEPE